MYNAIIFFIIMLSPLVLAVITALIVFSVINLRRGKYRKRTLALLSVVLISLYLLARFAHNGSKEVEGLPLPPRVITETQITKMSKLPDTFEIKGETYVRIGGYNFLPPNGKPVANRGYLSFWDYLFFCKGDVHTLYQYPSKSGYKLVTFTGLYCLESEKDAVFDYYKQNPQDDWISINHNLQNLF
jgi:hypothetical protein